MAALGRALFWMAFVTVCRAAAPEFRIVAYPDRYEQPTSLIETVPGLFYGVTGSSTHAIFSVTPSGTMAIVTSFSPGYNIGSQLVAASNGRFYSAVELRNKPATIFSVASAAGRETYVPQNLAPALSANLPDGSLLGTAVGLSGSPWYLVKVSLDGVLETIAELPAAERFNGTAVYAADGHYYGIAQANAGSSGYVFRWSAPGTISRFHEFPAGTFVTHLPAPLIPSADGFLYGAVPSGGPNGGGFIYSLSLTGEYKLLYAFPKGDTSAPTSLIEASDGNLYGATEGNLISGGTGELFRLTKKGVFTVLTGMEDPARDGVCHCDLVQGSDGIIYGTAQGGGMRGKGAVFAMDAGLPKPRPWPRAFSPTSGRAGTRVLIWGENLLGAAVHFNGIAGRPVSNAGPNYIWAVVPPGAAGGSITIVTPGGKGIVPGRFTVK